MTTLQEARKRFAEREWVSISEGPRSYYLIIAASLMLLGIGIVMVLSATSVMSIRQNDGNPFAGFISQVQYVLLGLPLAFVASRLPVATYKKLAPWALMGTFGLQLLILTPLAISAGGNTNWVLIPGINQSLQPSEFLKIGLALWLGLYLSTNRNLEDPKVLAVPAIVSGIALALVLGGSDLGTAMVIGLMVVGAGWIAGVPARYFGYGGLAALFALAALVAISPSRTARLLSFAGVGETVYQTKHGLWGLGTGGLTGVGLGASREKWSYLPAAHNDFIFAIIGEELGLLGTLLVLGLFGALAYGMIRLIRRHPDPFVKITTAAFMSWIVGQSLVNMGVVMGLFPVIGVPLPLVSAGGSAMISTLIAIGIVLAFARDEPGAKQAMGVSSTAVRRSVAVVGRPGRG